MFIGVFWLQSLCWFALLREQTSYIVLSKNPSEYTDVRDSQWKSGTEKVLDHDHSYVMLYPTFAFKMPE